MKNSDFDRACLAAAFKESIPVLMGYIPLGIAFGFLFTQAGGAWWLTGIMSIFVYAGAGQYIMVPLLAAGMGIPSIAFAVAMVNLRHIFYGLSLLSKVPAKGWRRWYIVYALTDETFSLLSVLPRGTPSSHLVAVAFFNHLWWILGSLMGGLLGAAAQVEIKGIDFVLACLFAMLCCEQWRRRYTAWSLVSALAAYALLHWLLPQYSLVLSIAMCCVAALVWGATRKGETLHEIEPKHRACEGEK